MDLSFEDMRRTNSDLSCEDTRFLGAWFKWNHIDIGRGST